MSLRNLLIIEFVLVGLVGFMLGSFMWIASSNTLAFSLPSWGIVCVPIGVLGLLYTMHCVVRFRTKMLKGSGKSEDEVPWHQKTEAWAWLVRGTASAVVAFGSIWVVFMVGMYTG